jgi:hypothetical protein
LSLFNLANLLNTTAAVDAVVRAIPVPLLLKEISEDLSIVSRLLTPANQTADGATGDDKAEQRDDIESPPLSTNVNATGSNNITGNSTETTSTVPPLPGLDQLHLTNRLRTASDELRRFRLLGLPSLGDILDGSANLTRATLNRTLERLASRQPLWNQLNARDSLKGAEGDGNTTSTASIVIEDDGEYYYEDYEEEGKLKFILELGVSIFFQNSQKRRRLLFVDELSVKYEVVKDIFLTCCTK